MEKLKKQTMHMIKVTFNLRVECNYDFNILNSASAILGSYRYQVTNF